MTLLQESHFQHDNIANYRNIILEKNSSPKKSLFSDVNIIFKVAFPLNIASFLFQFDNLESQTSDFIKGINYHLQAFLTYKTNL